MLIADDIFISIWNAKTYSLELMQRIKDKEVYGESVEADENKLLILVQWIRILEDYYDDLEGGNIPDENCFTYPEIRQLMDKISLMIDIKLPDSNYGLLQSQLNDESTWNDLFLISDNVTFT